jgi:ribonuclease P protein component
MGKNSFPSSKRLDQRGVQQALRKGRRKQGQVFEIRSISAAEEKTRGARLAISVPKRLLKSAVRRNRVKRLVREAFRHHSASARPLDMLIVFRAKPLALGAQEKKAYRMDIDALFAGVEAGFMTSRPHIA